MVIPRIDRDSRDLTRSYQINEMLGTWFPSPPRNLEEVFFHEITKLDLDTWKTEINIRITPV